MANRILTLNPDGKKGVNISKAKYNVIRDAIIQALKENGECTFSDLRTEVEERLADDFQGSISWYFTTVKLDLEARGIIERTDARSPQRIRLVSKAT